LAEIILPRPPKTLPKILPKSERIPLAVSNVLASFPDFSSRMRVSFHAPVTFTSQSPKASMRGSAASRRIKNTSYKFSVTIPSLRINQVAVFQTLSNLLRFSAEVIVFDRPIATFPKTSPVSLRSGFSLGKRLSTRF